jgi:hypothetical protein
VRGESPRAPVLSPASAEAHPCHGHAASRRWPTYPPTLPRGCCHPPCRLPTRPPACPPVHLPARQPASQPSCLPASLHGGSPALRRSTDRRRAHHASRRAASRRVPSPDHLPTTCPRRDCRVDRLPCLPVARRAAVPPACLPVCLPACQPACLPAHRLTAPSANRRRAFHASCRVAHRRVPWPAPAAAVCLAPAVPPCRPPCRSPCRPPRRVRRPEAASIGAAPTVAASRAAYRRSALRAAERRRLPPACAVPMLPRRRRRAADRRRPAWCLAVPPACLPAYRLARRIAGALDARRIAGVPTMPAAQRVAACIGP